LHLCLRRQDLARRRTLSASCGHRQPPALADAVRYGARLAGDTKFCGGPRMCDPDGQGVSCGPRPPLSAQRRGPGPRSGQPRGRGLARLSLGQNLPWVLNGETVDAGSTEFSPDDLAWVPAHPTFVGDGVDNFKLAERVAGEQVENVMLHNLVPKSTSTAVLSAVTGGLMLLRGVGLFRCGVTPTRSSTASRAISPTSCSTAVTGWSSTRRIVPRSRQRCGPSPGRVGCLALGRPKSTCNSTVACRQSGWTRSSLKCLRVPTSVGRV
jgi:hypothetical protein